MKTHEFTEDALRDLWEYHRQGEPFGLRKALELARDLLSENPEMQTQIHEGRAWRHAREQGISDTAD